MQKMKIERKKKTELIEETNALSQRVAELEEAGETLKSEENKLQAIVDGLARTPIGIDIVSIDYRVLFQNEALRQKFGDLTGKLCYEGYVGLKKPCHFCPLIKASKSKDVENLELMGADGRYYELFSAPLLNPDGTVGKVIEAIIDVTARKQAENNLSEYRNHLEELVRKRTAELTETNKRLEQEIADHKQTEEELQELNKEEVRLRHELETQVKKRVEFTRALVHELKTPLTPLVAASDFLTSEINEEPLLSFVKTIRMGTSNLSHRIDELLDLASGEVGTLKMTCKPVNSLQLLQDIVTYVKPEALRNGQSLILNTPSCLPTVWADEDRLRQVLLNLLNNAIKFTRKRGRITVTAKTDNDRLVVEVQDTGCGISREEQKYLFEPYKRTEGRKEHLGGLGLGLALSKMFIELHGGCIRGTSQQGKGSTFVFSVPLKATSKKGEGHESSYY